MAVVMRSSVDDPQPLAAARNMARELNARHLLALKEQHALWWQDFWAKSLVEIGDPILEQRYYLSNYVMGSGSRDPDFPQGLFGLWVTSDDPRSVASVTKLLTWLEPHWGAFDQLLLIQGRTWVEQRADARHRGLLKALELRKAVSYTMPGSGGESVILKIFQR